MVKIPKGRPIFSVIRRPPAPLAKTHMKAVIRLRKPLLAGNGRTRRFHSLCRDYYTTFAGGSSFKKSSGANSPPRTHPQNAVSLLHLFLIASGQESTPSRWDDAPIGLAPKR